MREDKGIVKMEVSVVKENGTVALDGDVTVMATVGRDGKPLPSLAEHAARVRREGPPRLRWEPIRPGAGWGDDFPVDGSSRSSDQ